jgi:hypothetical protein
MLINLPISNVDSYVDIALSKRSDIVTDRHSFDSPEKIVYSKRLQMFDNLLFQIYLHKIAEGITEITFPIPLQNSEVIPSPYSIGGTIEITNGPNRDRHFKNEGEDAIYKICHSIWLKVKPQERILRKKSPSSSHEQQKSGRSNLPDDIWAWEQVNVHARSTSEVYKEWMNKDGVKARNLVDARRQFNRVIVPKWGNKSGRNI